MKGQGRSGKPEGLPLFLLLPARSPYAASMTKTATAMNLTDAAALFVRSLPEQPTEHDGRRLALVIADFMEGAWCAALERAKAEYVSRHASKCTVMRGVRCNCYHCALAALAEEAGVRT